MLDRTIKKIFEASSITGYLYLQKSELDDTTFVKLLALKPGEINIILARTASFVRNDDKNKSRKELINDILEVLERSAVARKFVGLGLKQDYRLFRGFPVRKGDTYENMPAPGTDIALKPTEVYIGWSTDAAKAREEGVTYDATKGEPVGGLLVEAHIDSNKVLFDINAVLNAVKLKLNAINQYNISAAPGKNISKTNTDFLATEAPAYHGQWEIITSNKIVNVKVLDKWTWDMNGNQKVPRWVGDAQPAAQQPSENTPEEPQTAVPPTQPQAPQATTTPIAQPQQPSQVQENLRKLFESSKEEYCDGCDRLKSKCVCDKNDFVEIIDDRLDESFLDKMRGVTDWIKKTTGLTVRGKTLKYMDLLYKQHASNKKVYEIAKEFAEKKASIIDTSTQEGKDELEDLDQKISYADNQIVLLDRLIDDVKEGYLHIKDNPDRAISFAPVNDKEAEAPESVDAQTGLPKMKDDLKDVDEKDIPNKLQLADPTDSLRGDPEDNSVNVKAKTATQNQPIPFESGDEEPKMRDDLGINSDDDFELDKGITVAEGLDLRNSLHQIFIESVEALEILRPVVHSKYGTTKRPTGKLLDKLFNKLIAAIYKHYDFRIRALELQKELLETDFASYKGTRWESLPTVQKLREMIENTKKSLALVVGVRKKLDEIKDTAKDFMFTTGDNGEKKSDNNPQNAEKKDVTPVGDAEANFRRAEGILKAAEAGEKKSDKLDNDEAIVSVAKKEPSKNRDDIIDFPPSDSEIKKSEEPSTKKDEPVQSKSELEKIVDKIDLNNLENRKLAEELIEKNEMHNSTEAKVKDMYYNRGNYRHWNDQDFDEYFEKIYKKNSEIFYKLTQKMEEFQKKFGLDPKIKITDAFLLKLKNRLAEPINKSITHPLSSPTKAPEVIPAQPNEVKTVARAPLNKNDVLELPPELMPKKVRKPRIPKTKKTMSLGVKDYINNSIKEKGYVEYSPKAAKAFKVDHPDWKEDISNPKKIKFFPPKEEVKSEPVVEPTKEPEVSEPPKVEPATEVQPIQKVEPSPKPVVEPQTKPIQPPVIQPPTKLAKDIPLPNRDVDSYISAHSELNKVKKDLDEQKKKLPTRVDKPKFQEIIKDLESKYSAMTNNVKHFASIVGIPPENEEFNKLVARWATDKKQEAEVGIKKRKKR